MASLRYVTERLVVEGAHVAAFYTMHADWQGETPIEVRGVQHLVVGDGHITHRTDYWDSAVFLCQASPEAKSAPRPLWHPLTQGQTPNPRIRV